MAHMVTVSNRIISSCRAHRVTYIAYISQRRINIELIPDFILMLGQILFYEKYLHDVKDNGYSRFPLVLSALEYLIKPF